MDVYLIPRHLRRRATELECRTTLDKDNIIQSQTRSCYLETGFGQSRLVFKSFCINHIKLFGLWGLNHCVFCYSLIWESFQRRQKGVYVGCFTHEWYSGGLISIIRAKYNDMCSIMVKSQSNLKSKTEFCWIVYHKSYSNSWNLTKWHLISRRQTESN